MESNLLLEAVIVGDVKDVLGVVEGGLEPPRPLLHATPLPGRDPFGLLPHQLQLREKTLLQIAQLLRLVEAEKGKAMVEEPGGDG